MTPKPAGDSSCLPPHTRLSLDAICVPGSVFLPVRSRFSGHLFCSINLFESLDTQFACRAFSFVEARMLALMAGIFLVPQTSRHAAAKKHTLSCEVCFFISAMPDDSLLPAQRAPQKMDLAVFFGLAEKNLSRQHRIFSRENPPALINGHIDWI